MHTHPLTLLQLCICASDGFIGKKETHRQGFPKKAAHGCLLVHGEVNNSSKRAANGRLAPSLHAET